MKYIKSFTLLLALALCAVSCEDSSEIWSPGDLNVSGITSSTAVLGWGGVGDEYEVRLGNSEWKVKSRNVSVKDLAPDAEIRWSVRAVQDGTHSEWKEHSFKTLPLPARPERLGAVPSFKTAELTWSGTEKKYQVKVNDSLYETSVAKVTATGFTPSTKYTWSVRSVRGTDSSEWVQADFTTLARPAAPTGLTVTASYTSATFKWSGGEPEYELKVGEKTYTVKGTEYTLDDLSSGTAYRWSVRASAGDGVYSDWAESSFTTKVALTAQVRINSLNVMAANITITPGNGVSAFAIAVASKELYQDFVDIYTDGDEVAFMEAVGEVYETGAPTTGTFELNGSTGYDYYAVVLLYDSNGDPFPEVIKQEFTSPAYQQGLPEAGVSVAVSDVTATSARVVITPDDHALGFYEGIFEKDSYDETVAESGEEYIMQYLSVFGYMYFTTDDNVWGSLTPATEYIAVAVPFNANGTDGFGKMVTKPFKTLAGNSVMSTQSQKKDPIHRTGEVRRRALTDAETVRKLMQQKKK